MRSNLGGHAGSYEIGAAIVGKDGGAERGGGGWGIEGRRFMRLRMARLALDRRRPYGVLTKPMAMEIMETEPWERMIEGEVRRK